MAVMRLTGAQLSSSHSHTVTEAEIKNMKAKPFCKER